MPHVRALDGLRGLAVAGVFAFHAGRLRGGYLGVDLFFVLSGYLITSILLREIESTGRVDLRAFWIRRSRRLLPALLALMPAVALYAKAWASPTESATLRKDAVATLAYVANWRAIFSGKSYWEIFAAPSPLEHTWSLAIEEQFYLVWPLAVAFVLVGLRKTRRTLFVVSGWLALLSAALMLLLWHPERTSRVYMGSDTRAAAILAGAALATVLSPSRGVELGRRFVRGLDGAGLFAMLGLGFAWATLDGQDEFLYHGGFWLTEGAALVLISCAVCPGSVVARVLSFRPLVWLGTISYGIYLWHWPVDVVLTPARVHVDPLVLDAGRLVVTLTLALASYHWIELPIRWRGVFFGRPVVVVPGAFAVTVLLILWGTKVKPPPPPVAIAPPANVVEPPRWPDFNSVRSNALPIASELPPGTRRILVLGDSVAQYLGEAMRFHQADATSFVAQRGVGACSIHEAEVRYVNGERIEGTSCSKTWGTDVAELEPDVTLIVLGGAYLGPRTCKPDWRKAYRKRLTFLIHSMGEKAGHVVLALVPYPGQRWRTPNMVELVDCFNDELKQIADAERLETIDLKTHVCPTTECTLLSNGAPIRPDGLHFDGPGAVETARWTLAEIHRIVEVHGDMEGAAAERSER